MLEKEVVVKRLIFAKEKKEKEKRKWSCDSWIGQR